MMGFRTVYNKLQAESVCDSLQRLVVDVSAPTVRQVDVSVADPSLGEFILSYEITGSCRGCPEPLLFEDSINRDQSPNRELIFLETMHNVRGLVTTCTCPAEGEDRGLEQDDFVNAYQMWIDRKLEMDELENLNGLVGLSETGTFNVMAADESTWDVSAGASSPGILLHCLFVLLMSKILT